MDKLAVPEILLARIVDWHFNILMQAILLQTRKGVLGNPKIGVPVLLLLIISSIWFIIRITETVNLGNLWIPLFVAICALSILIVSPKYSWALYFDPQSKILFSELVPAKSDSKPYRRDTIGKVLGMTVFKNENPMDGMHDGWQIDFLVEGKNSQSYYEFRCSSEEQAREIADKIGAASGLKPHIQN